MTLRTTLAKGTPARRLAASRHQADQRQDVLRELGDHVRENRLGRGVTQETLAGALGLSVAYISLIERGKRNPPFTTVIAIARALGVAASDLATE